MSLFTRLASLQLRFRAWRHAAESLDKIFQLLSGGQIGGDVQALRQRWQWWHWFRWGRDSGKDLLTSFDHPGPCGDVSWCLAMSPSHLRFKSCWTTLGSSWGPSDDSGSWQLNACAIDVTVLERTRAERQEVLDQFEEARQLAAEVPAPCLWTAWIKLEQIEVLVCGLSSWL